MMNKIDLLICGERTFPADKLTKIEQLGFNLIPMPDEAGPLPDGAENVRAVVCGSLFLYHKLNELPALRLVQANSAGLDRFPLDELKQLEIPVFNARGAYSAPIAESTICGLLMIFRGAVRFLQNQQRCEWVKQRNLLELSGRRVLIVGAGSIGCEIATRIRSFGCTTVAVTRSTAQDSDCFDEAYHNDCLDEQLSRCDIVIFAVPGTAETVHMLDSRRIELMKRSAVVVNISRGQVVDEQALTAALQQKRLYGAVLDVFENEPLDRKSALWQMENVIITPHNTNAGEHANDRLFDIVYANLEEFAGKV